MSICMYIGVVMWTQGQVDSAKHVGPMFFKCVRNLLHFRP